jgi:hypothetical protein
MPVEPPLHLALDEPSLSGVLPVSDSVKVTGWAAGPTSGVRIEVWCEGVQLGLSQVGIPRPDVATAHPELADAERSGFSMVIDLSPLSPGKHELAIRAVDTRHRAAEASRPIVIEKRQSTRSTLRPTCKRFALYASSVGNYFFDEIRSLLAAGLRELGFVVEIRDERNGFADDADWHIVVAPHEFFYLEAGREMLRETPPGLILVNTEQPSTQWFSLALECFPRAHSIWDINHESSLLVNGRGYACGYLALGYVPGFEPANRVEALPEHYGTSFMEPQIRNHLHVGAGFAERPIDVLFVGHASRRRERFFAKIAPVLSRYHCYLHFSDVSAPVIPGVTTHMNTATVIGLAQRTKILLNIHHGNDRYFEWHRIVILGIWQRALVISEPCGAAPPIQAGVDFVEASLEQMPETIDHYLCSAEGLREGQEIAQRGFRTFTERCRLADSLRRLILELYAVPEFPRRFGGTSREADGRIPNDVTRQTTAVEEHGIARKRSPAPAPQQ